MRAPQPGNEVGIAARGAAGRGNEERLARSRLQNEFPFGALLVKESGGRREEKLRFACATIEAHVAQQHAVVAAQRSFQAASAWTHVPAHFEDITEIGGKLYADVQCALLRAIIADNDG